MALIDWKSVFTLALVALLGWYLLNTQGGKTYLDELKSLFGNLKLPDIFSGQAAVETGNTTMHLSVQKSLFDGKSFYVKNSSFNGIGTCDLNVSTLMFNSNNISIDIVDGKVAFATKDSKMGVNIHGTSSGLKIDGTKGFPIDKGIDINVDCVSDSFSVTSILENTITLAGANGQVSGDKGELKLTNDTVEVQGFKGDLQVSGNSVTLNGTVLKILLSGEKAII